MKRTHLHRHARRALVAATVVLSLLLGLVTAPATAAPGGFIVQGESAAVAAAAVDRVGGKITHQLGIIQSVAAELTDAQRAALEARPEIRRVWENRQAELTSKGGKANPGGGGGSSQVVETYYPTHLGADQLHAAGIDGSGVTIAVLDSGIFSDNGLTKDRYNNGRVLTQYDAVLNLLLGEQHSSTSFPADEQGHGSHVTSIAVSSRQTSSGNFNGMAPDADLVVVKAFDRYGRGTYADVIRGIDWVIANRFLYGIRVLNCSFSAEPQSYYWDDPLNQAVMTAWQMGIVVVASAGNRGPKAMSIGVPGNVPYVITVGAMTDNYTPANYADDILARFSSAGPTVEGFVKPDLVAPGGHVRGLMKTNAQIALDHPEFHDGGYYFNMSGTSQATAFVSGTVALMLEVSGALTPDEVKFRLMQSANRASFSGGSPTYTIFQQGAGRLDAYGAVHSIATGRANRGLDVNLDLLGLQHYRGAADAYKKPGQDGGYVFFVRDADGNAIEDDGYFWSDQYAYQDGFAWSDGYVWSDGFFWSDGYFWSDGFAWSDGYTWSDGYVWSDLYTEALFTENWVPQE